MKGVAMLLFLIFIPNVNAAWEQYQGNLFNTGKADGIGYFGSKPIANITNNFDGMDFQPLVSDLDDNGKNEIVIFSGNYLKIFDAKLSLIAEKFSGNLLGQPVIYNIDGDLSKEVVFIANISDLHYFFAYQYNNSFFQEFNFSIPNGGIGSGVKCAGIGSTNICVFMDNKQYIHIVNMSSKNDSSHNTSVYNDILEKIPAIGDIDDDGNLEAVFWFDKNNNNNYGIMVFDIENKSLETNFNNSGIVDDIVQPYGVNSDAFILKGHPVLVDLNNDNKLEIAVSIFYDDTIPLFEAFDWFTELFVYSNNGSELFRKCEERASSSPENCNDGSSLRDMWQGTNPLVFDANSDGMNDICFIKDKKDPTHFKNMTINCYNYSGGKLLDSEITPTTDTIIYATAADINNDGVMEVITENNIYSLNGKSIFKHNFGSNFVIPVDIDGNNGLDLIWSKANKTIIFLDNTSYSFDPSIEEKDILFEKNNTKIVIHNNGDGFIDNLEILAINTDTMQNQTKTASIRANSNITLDFNLTINKKETLLVQLDHDNKINETDEKNNFAFKKFEGFPFAFVSVDLDINNLEEEFVGYIKDNLKSSYYTNSENNADIKIYIGKNNLVNKQKSAHTRFNFDYYYDFGNIYYKDKVGSYPYNGLISSYKDESGMINILIYGNNIDGTIAAVKEFIAKEADFINTGNENSFFIDDENLNAVKIFDFLHNTGNENNYLADNDAFRNIVRNALRDEMFVQKDYTVNSASGVNLRLRNLKPNASEMYISYLNSTGIPVELPVVLAHGLFSNLSTWQGLASEISNTGRDTWLIEITGGPGQDCEDCVDYSFYNLTDDYVPALLNGVLTFTGKDNLQYVGFSNGCRAALDSLERNKFDSNKVETFVAVGCPGSFEGESALGSIIASKDGEISKKLESINKHNTFETTAVAGLFNREFIPKEASNKISLNLWKFYEKIINSSFDNQPGNINIQNFVIIQGSALTSNDGIVTIKDEQKIFQNVNHSNSKKHFDIFALHTTLDGKDRTKSIIKKSLNNQELSFYEKTLNLINQSN
ncbi:alpha/beta hydrolase [Candidatus Woesearchaeota archaeon]|nr:alpha/beta hydrolase [Candidatus Woesearchaeota archaeon]